MGDAWDLPQGSGGGGGAVSSVFSRTGAVVALVGDYAAFYDSLGAAAAAQAAAIAASAQRASNLSDLASASAARTNLGLGTAATHAATDFDAAGAAAAAQAAAIAASDPVGSATAVQNALSVIPGQSYLAGTVNGRRAVMSMGGDGASGYATPTNSDICQRWGFTLPVAPYRFRFRIRNCNVTGNTIQAGSLTLTGMYIGIPNTAATNQWNGDFTGTPTSLGLAVTQEMGSSEYVSGWITPSTIQLAANTFYGLSMGLTCSGVQISRSTGPAWSWMGTGSAAAAANAAVPGTTAQPYTPYLDVRMEYEFNGNNQIGLYIGDSIMAGQVGITTAAGQMGPNATWPGMAGLRLGHGVMNGGASGSTAASWNASATTSTLGFTRFLSPESGYTAFATVPDYCCMAIGVNDAVYFGTALPTLLSTYQTNMLQLMAKVRALGIRRTYMGTCTTGFNLYALTPVCQAGQLLYATPGSAITSIFVGSVASVPAVVMTGCAGSTTTITTSGSANKLVSGSLVVVTAGTGSFTFPTYVQGIASSLGNFTVSASPAVTLSAATVVAFNLAGLVGGPGLGGGQPGPASSWYPVFSNPGFVLGTPQAPISPAGTVYTTTSATGGGGPGGVLQLGFASTSIPAAPAGTPVLTPDEWLRQSFNLWIRQCPPGVQSVIDFEADITYAGFYPATTGRPEYFDNTGNIHPTGPAMYSQMASRFVNGIVGT